MDVRNRFSAALTALVLGACAGSPVSLTAQRGASILVPLGSYNEIAGGTVQLGFGRPQQPGGGANNAAWVDAQRGELEFYVDDGADPGEIFLLRATSASKPSPASSYARNPGLSYRNEEVVALLDVPTNAPLGQQALRYRNKLAPETSESIGNIWVLPNQVLLCEAPCGTTGIPSVAGQPSPFVIAGSNINSVVERTRPDPQLVVSFPATVHAVELQVFFSASKGDIVDAFEYDYWYSNDLAWASITPCEPFGNYCRHFVKAVAASEDGIDNLALVFELSGTTPITLTNSDVIINALLARDEFGNPIQDFPENPNAALPHSSFFIR